MGWTQKRKTKDGVGRFCACYRDICGQVQRASTFAEEREADKAGHSDSESLCPWNHPGPGS